MSRKVRNRVFKMRRSTVPPARLTSVRQLAAAINRSHTSAIRWTRHAEWRWPRAAPWSAADVPAMVEWARQTLDVDPAADARREEQISPGTMSKLQMAKTALIAERAVTTRARRELLLGQYHLVEE